MVNPLKIKIVPWLTPEKKCDKSSLLPSIANELTEQINQQDVLAFVLGLLPYTGIRNPNKAVGRAGVSVPD